MEKAAHVPGPGFVPFLAAIVLGFLSIGVLIKSITGENNKSEGTISLSYGNFKEIVLLSAVLVGYALLLNTLGFILSMSSLMVFLFRGQGKRGKVKKWLMPIWLGLLVTLVSYFIFSYLLGLQLPKGVFGV
jgi:hypothetical protein